MRRAKCLQKRVCRFGFVMVEHSDLLQTEERRVQAADDSPARVDTGLSRLSMTDLLAEACRRRQPSPSLARRHDGDYTRPRPIVSTAAALPSIVRPPRAARMTTNSSSVP